MPSVHFGDPYLMCSGNILQIMVEFPNRAISILAAPVRFDRLDESLDEHKYLIGARILQMTKSDRRYLVQYIRSGGRVPEVMSSIVRRFHNFLINRFHARRSGIRLPLTVSLLDSKSRDVCAQYSPAMSGYLHDISRTGLSLVVPPVHFGNRYPIGSAYTLRIRVELPSGPINIQATPVRFDWVEEGQGERKRLIGARVTHMTGADRRTLVQHIQQVKKSKAVASKTSFAHDTRSF
jgi:hypothetical protein